MFVRIYSSQRVGVCFHLNEFRRFMEREKLQYLQISYASDISDSHWLRKCILHCYCFQYTVLE